MKDKYIILIGGAPTTGKSTLAKKLAKDLDIPWISTDQIREYAQEVLENHKTEYPILFNDENHDAESFLNKYSPLEVAKMEMEQSEAVFGLINKFIKKSYPWKSFIIEGVNVLPELISQIQFDGKVIPIFLVDEDRDRVRKVVFERGLWGPANTYSDSVKEKEVEWVFEFSRILKEKCKEHGFDIFEVSKNDGDFDRIVKVIGDKNYAK